jgi:O-antigen/teichoic acid export membrane protein
MFIRNIISFTRSQLDLLLITKLFGDTGAGNFSVAKRFAIMPMGEVLQPAMGPIFSYLSQLKEKPTELEAKTYQSIFFIYMILTPFFVGLMAISESFTAVVLGEKWMSLSEYIGLLGFLMFPFAVQPIFLILYDAANKIFLSMIIDLVSIVLLVVGYITLDIVDIYTFVILRIGVGAITLTLSYLMICRILPIDIIKLLTATFLPCLLSSVIFVGLFAIPISNDNIYLQFGLEVMIGASFYVVTSGLLFWSIVQVSPASFSARLLPNKAHDLLLNFKLSRISKFFNSKKRASR